MGQEQAYEITRTDLKTSSEIGRLNCDGVYENAVDTKTIQVGGAGFEPAKAFANGFTARPV